MHSLPPSESAYSLISSLNNRELSELERLSARMSPANFAQLASNGKWMPASHLMLINQLLVWLDQRAIDRLVITLAPRMGKSELISKYFPAWTIGRKPNDDYILASYEADFAAEWGRKVRDILVEHGQRFFGVKLRQDSKAADHWRIENAAGGMQTCGVGGPLTGKGADILAIDDPFKNMEEANSDTIRAKKMDWFRTAAYTRLSPTAAMIMVATRWHEGDITGVVLDEMKDGGDQWTYLHLPALHEGKEVWADLTIPGEHAERIKAHEGMTFKQLNAFFEHCKTAA